MEAFSHLIRRGAKLIMSAVAVAAPADQPANADDRRPWEPPFDPAQPAPPISYPITTLSALASRDYLASFHYPFNRASVPLAGDGLLPARRRILVCHDMQGGYRDDLLVQGGGNEGAYTIWHWRLMDVFVYFSHYLVTLPPPGWVNAAHTHGVKVLGTILMEWDNGRETCEEMLATSSSARMYAERLAELAAALGFDGWLINLEVTLKAQLIDNLKEFIEHLSCTMHSSVPGSLVIWYDAVTIYGDLDWQNKLNDKNKPFFDLCDGIFVNYTWNESSPQYSAAEAGDRKYDVYMGIDVFGRNTYGGGQWNTNVALDLLKKEDVSAAIFAPGWVYETKQGPDFQTAQNRWWNLVEKSWGQLLLYPKTVPFYSNFDQGHGNKISVQGSQVYTGPWNNNSCQTFQPILTDDTGSPQVSVNFVDTPYSGGGSLTVQGNLQQGTLFSTQIFAGSLPLQDSPLQILYNVKSDETVSLSLSLQLLSRNNENSSAIITEDAGSFSSPEPEDTRHTKIIKSAKQEIGDNREWVQYKAILNPDGQTLSGIYIVCSAKNHVQFKAGRKERLELAESVASFSASLGQISIVKDGESMLFPSADAWSTLGEHISWSEDPNGVKLLSMKLSWVLKAGQELSLAKYNIYFKILGKDQHSDDSYKYLGVARVQAYYISDLNVPKDVTGLLFVIQACSYDGSVQELGQSPSFKLAV